MKDNFQINDTLIAKARWSKIGKDPLTKYGDLIFEALYISCKDRYSDKVLDDFINEVPAHQRKELKADLLNAAARIESSASRCSHPEDKILKPYSGCEKCELCGCSKATQGRLSCIRLNSKMERPRNLRLL